MSTTLKLIIAAIVVLALAAGGYYWYTHKQGSAVEEMKEGGLEKGAESGEKAAAPAPAPSTSLPTGKSTSDASLQKDAAAVDAQLNAFSSDNATINSHLNDQQVQQSSL